MIRICLCCLAREINNECVSTMCVMHVVDLTVSITYMVYVVVLVVGTHGVYCRQELVMRTRNLKVSMIEDQYGCELILKVFLRGEDVVIKGCSPSHVCEQLDAAHQYDEDITLEEYDAIVDALENKYYR